MRRLFRLKPLLLAMLGVLVIFHPLPPALSQGLGEKEADRPVDWRDVPTRVSNAYWEYAGINSSPNPGRGTFMLRAYVASELRRDGDLMDVEADRRLVGAVGWDATFIAELDRAIAWGETLLDMPHAEIHALSRKFSDEILASDGNLEPFENDDRRLLDLALFARDLQELAIQRGSYAALLDQFERYLGARDRPLRSHGMGGLEMLANDGYAPAQRVLSRRLIEGRGFDVNLLHALYWARLGQSSGVDTADLRQRVEKQVSTSDKQLVKEWVDRYQPTQNLDNLFKVPSRKETAPEKVENRLEVVASSEIPRPLRQARENYLGRDQDPNPDTGRFQLIEYVTQELTFGRSFGDLETVRQELVAANWEAQFLQEFDRQIMWLKTLLAKPPGEIFEQALRFAGSLDSEVISDGEGPGWSRYARRRIVTNIASLAFDQGSGEAGLYLAEYYLRQSDGGRIDHGRGHLWLAAVRGFGPAQLELARRYAVGDNFANDPEKAYYWASRASKNGQDVLSILDATRSRLTPGQIERLEGNLEHEEPGYPLEPWRPEFSNRN